MTSRTHVLLWAVEDARYLSRAALSTIRRARKSGGVGISAISVWELKEIRRQLQQQGRDAVNEDLIFSAYARMREISDSARRTTKAARRDEQRMGRERHA